MALAKFLNNKLCPVVVAEAMEILGGMGYVEETPLPMLYREAPLNGIWEGSGNVIALDILRTMARDPDAARHLTMALQAPRHSLPAYDRAFEAWARDWSGLPSEAEARRFAAETARLLTAAELIASAPTAVAEAYAATRLEGASVIYGASRLTPAPLLERLSSGA